MRYVPWKGVDAFYPSLNFKVGDNVQPSGFSRLVTPFSANLFNAGLMMAEAAMLSTSDPEHLVHPKVNLWEAISQSRLAILNVLFKL